VTVEFSAEAPRQPELLELMRQGDEFTLGLYPPESAHLLDVTELEKPGVTVFVARSEGDVVGMAALVDRGDATAELKRMFVVPSARGLGVGAGLLASVDAHAVATGIRTVQLETGPLQDVAIRLYQRGGYSLIPSFGKYVGDPNSVCYEKALP
jgi:putative acetyltransferase